MNIAGVWGISVAFHFILSHKQKEKDSQEELAGFDLEVDLAGSCWLVSLWTAGRNAV